jgi:MFS family permease
VVATVVAPFAGRLADRIGPAPILTVGGAAGVAGMAVHLSLTGTAPAYVTGLLLPGLLIGLAAGCSFAMLVGATMRDVPQTRFGMGGAGRTTVFQLSIALGVAVAVAVVGRPASAAEALDAMRTTWAIAAALFAAQMLTFGVVFPRVAGRRVI